MIHKCQVKKSRIYGDWIYACGSCGVIGYRPTWGRAITAALRHLRERL